MVGGLNDYCKEAHDQLGDDSVYEKIERDPVESLSKLANKKLIVLKEKGFITEENRRYLKGKNNKLGRFYLLFTWLMYLVDQ